MSHQSDSMYPESRTGWRLGSHGLIADVDPDRGGEVVRLRCLREGAGGGWIDLLCRPPWRDAPVVPVAQEDEWTRAWRGGWFLAWPNAGAGATVGGHQHGFHGEASQARWDLVSRSTDSICLAFSTATGLQARRVVLVDQASVTIKCDVWNPTDRPQASLATEHLVLGAALVTEDLVITGLPWPIRLDNPDGTPRMGPRHSEAAGDWSRPFADRGSRFGVAGPLHTNVAIRMSSQRLRVALELTWTRRDLPFLWVWQELGGLAHPPWEGATSALGLEPSNCAHGAGVGGFAVEDVPTLRPGQRQSWQVRLTVVQLGDADAAEGDGSQTRAITG